MWVCHYVEEKVYLCANMYVNAAKENQQGKEFNISRSMYVNKLFKFSF